MFDVAAVADRLTAAGCVAAAEEAAEILAAPDERTVEVWVRRREQGEPLAWITGTVGFCGQRLSVAPGVYVPRPQSEELARRAATVLPENGRAVDLCTGAGAIAAHLMARVPTARVIGVDIDRIAAACARRNGVATAVADAGDTLRTEWFDLVTAVPPYVPTAELRLLASDVQRYEPRLAHDGGPDGLSVVEGVLAAARRLLRPSGWLLVEIGGDQLARLEPLVAATRFDLVTAWRDADGDLRGIACQRSGSRPISGRCGGPGGAG